MSGLTTAKALREKRATLANEAEAILAKANTEKRDLSAEENVSFDKIHADIEELRGQVEKVEKHERIMKEMSESRGRQTVEDTPKGGSGDERAEQRAKHDEAFNAYLRHGIEGLAPEQRSLLSFSRDTERGVNESRAAQTVTTSGGGYLIPQGFSGQLESAMKAYGSVESVADVITTDTGNPLPWPTVDDTSNTGRLLAINTQATQTGLTYGVKTLNAYKFSSDVVLVPVELLQDSAFDMNGHLAEKLGERLGRVKNTYETTGTGSSQPQGVAVGATSGVTAAGTTAITYDELLDLEHSVDPAYRIKGGSFGAGFMFADSVLKFLKKLKDDNNRPLWQAGIAGGAPDTIDDFPYTINQDMPAMTTGLTPIAFGAMKKFKVRNVKDVTLLRLVERYADYHQVGFLAFLRMDSLLIDAGTHPIKVITMA